MYIDGREVDIKLSNWTHDYDYATVRYRNTRKS